MNCLINAYLYIKIKTILTIRNMFLSKTQKTIFQKMKLGCYKITLHKWAFALIFKTLVYEYAMFQNSASNYMQ